MEVKSSNDFHFIFVIGITKLSCDYAMLCNNTLYANILNLS